MSEPKLDRLLNSNRMFPN